LARAAVARAFLGGYIMQKPVCPKCARYFRPKQNGTYYVEMKPIDGSVRSPPGLTEPEMWKPYKLWMGDLWICHGCGAEIIVGAGYCPISEDYMDGFTGEVERVTIKVNDC
jgi:ribosomal protein L37AE/L43A